MLLKRIYDRSGDKPKLDHIKVSRISKTQKITQQSINRLMVDNAVTVGDGKIVLHTVPALTYDIIRMPGYYCCFDEKPLSDQKTARKYVAENFADEKSPDKENPAGYRKDDFYFCELMGEK